MAMTSWAVDRPVNSPFALPQGLVGRLAGRFMLRINKRAQAEVAELLAPAPGSRVLEIGFGPGGLTSELVRRTRAAEICGVDPSADMVAVATRVNRSAGDRVSLRQGTAADTGYPDSSLDGIVSVNNVAIWPDLEAGLRELHRIVRPQGTVLISWHGGTAPIRYLRRLVLPAAQLARIQRGLEGLFGSVVRHELSTQTAFAATRRLGGPPG